MNRVDRLKTLWNSGGYFPVGHTTHIRVTGADRSRYLNGQLTVDILKLAANSARSALLLTPKGKLCAPLWVWQDGESFVLEVVESLREETLARLERYIISDDVSLEVLAPPAPVFHVFRGDASGSLKAEGAEAGPGGSDPVKIPRLGICGYDTAEAPVGLIMADPAEVDFLRIKRAIPRWGSELDSNTLPQEASLDSSSVDFHKGCYVGQEVVSRLKSVGRVNRRLFAFRGTLVPTSEEPLSLYLPGRPGELAGVLTSRSSDFELAESIGLGYLNREFEDSESFVAADMAGNALGKLEKRPILT